MRRSRTQRGERHSAPHHQSRLEFLQLVEMCIILRHIDAVHPRAGEHEQVGQRNGYPTCATAIG